MHEKNQTIQRSHRSSRQSDIQILEHFQERNSNLWKCSTKLKWKIRPLNQTKNTLGHCKSEHRNNWRRCSVSNVIKLLLRKFIPPSHRNSIKLIWLRLNSLNNKMTRISTLSTTLIYVSLSPLLFPIIQFYRLKMSNNTHEFHQNVLRLYLRMCFEVQAVLFSLALDD